MSEYLDVWLPFAFVTLTRNVQTGPGTPGVLRANKSVFLGEVSGTETGVHTTTTANTLLQTRNCEYHLLWN